MMGGVVTGTLKMYCLGSMPIQHWAQMSILSLHLPPKRWGVPHAHVGGGGYSSKGLSHRGGTNA